MKRTVRRRSLYGGKVYVEFSIQRDGRWDLYWYELDPRKSQYYKPKFWSRRSSHGWGDLQGAYSHCVNGPITDHLSRIGAQILREDFGLTSSDGRANAAASSARKVAGSIPTSGFNTPRGIPYNVSATRDIFRRRGKLNEPLG